MGGVDHGPRRQPQRRSGRGVADRVGREVLDRLFQSIAIAAHVFAAGLDRRAQGDLGGLARALVPRGHAIEELRHRHLLEGQRAAAALEARKIQEVADDPLEARRLVADDGEVARARRFVERQLGHRQRLEVTAHRGHGCRQLVRDVGEQLAADAIGGQQRLGARGEVVGHRVERARHRGDLVAAAVGRSRGEIARPEAPRRGLQAAQTPARGPEDHERGEHRADDEDAAGHGDERRREAAEQEAEGRARRHDDDAHRLAVGNDRDRPVEAEAGSAAVGPFGIRPVVINTARVRPACVEPSRVRPPELRPPELRPPELRPSGFRSSQLWPSGLRSSGLRSSGIRPPEALRPGPQARVREAQQWLRDRADADVDHRAIGEHHEKRMRHVRELLVHVVRDVGRRIAFERGGEVVGHRLREGVRRLAGQRAARSRDDPGVEHRLHHEHCGEEHHEAERDAPVEAAVPLHQNWDPNQMLIPNPESTIASRACHTLFIPAPAHARHNPFDACSASL